MTLVFLLHGSNGDSIHTMSVLTIVGELIFDVACCVGLTNRVFYRLVLNHSRSLLLNCKNIFALAFSQDDPFTAGLISARMWFACKVTAIPSSHVTLLLVTIGRGRWALTFQQVTQLWLISLGANHW